MASHEDFVRLLREGMQRRGMTQAQLAESLGIVSSAISAWKVGTVPTDKHLRGLERVLRIPYSQLKHALGAAVVITVPLDEHADAETRQLVADYVQLSNQDRGAVRNMVAALHATRQHTPVPLPDHEHTDNGTPRETPECRERETAESRRLL